MLYPKIYFDGMVIVTFLKINLWLTAPRGATSVNNTSGTNCQMEERRDNVINFTLRQVH